jgi:putative DNA-invertase from lambdoid prophage Rac
MKAAIYARVSTGDQTCEMQLLELREYLTRRGWDTAGEYVDAGFSGTKSSRPQLDRLMKDARQRRFDAVVVWKLDRWGRSLAHLVQSIQELSALGIRFIAVTQNIDTDESNPMARLLMHLMGAFAEFERELIRDRVKAGVSSYEQAYQAGEVGKRRHSHSGKDLAIGRPRTLFRRDEALALRKEGLSWRAIAVKLDVRLATLVRACSETPSISERSRRSKQGGSHEHEVRSEK